MIDAKNVRLRPSSAAIWAGAGCTMFPHMAAKYAGREMDNSAAEEGTAAHWVAERLLLNPAIYAPDLLAPNGVMVTEEMIEAVRVYVDYANGLRGGALVEAPVEVFKGCAGTPDFWTYDPQEKILHVLDYKHGFSIVEPIENWQLSLYAAGIIKHWSGPDVAPEKVRLTVVQPRAYTRDGSVRSWDTDAQTVESMRIQAATRAAEAQSNPVARSSSGCKHCPARHECPAAINGGVQLYEAATELQPYDLSASEMGVQYAILQRAQEQIGFLVSAYEEQIKSALYKGEKVPGYALEEKLGRETWNVDAAEVKLMGDMMGVDLCPPSPITPSQAKKLGVDSGVISAYTTRHSKGHNLTAVTLTKAKRIFS